MTTEKKSKTSPESIIRDIKRKTRRKFTAEEKICIVLEGLRKSEDIGSGVRRSINTQTFPHASNMQQILLISAEIMVKRLIVKG